MNLKGILTYLENTAAQPAVLSFISELPASPSDGDRYILDTGADEHSIAMYVTDEWVVYAPQKEWTCFVVAEDRHYKFDMQWEVIPITHYQDAIPDLNEAVVKDRWVKASMQLYEVVIADDDTTKFWIETTSPPIEEEK